MKPRRSWDIEGKGNRLYGRRWRAARGVFLSRHPLCCMCEREGRIVTATVVDHVIPHRGDEVLFWDSANWQALCEAHHNGEKATIEARGFSDRIGADGWPIDPAHPANVQGAKGVGGVATRPVVGRPPLANPGTDLVSEKTAQNPGKNEDFSVI